VEKLHEYSIEIGSFVFKISQVHKFGNRRMSERIL